MCGEKVRCPRCWCYEVGSPPRVRGKGRGGCRGTVQKGITPACAGKSRHERAAGPNARDHPRACGEKKSVADSNWYNLGSPPRVRGKGQHLHQEHALMGITPACAGKSPLLPCRHDNPWDHPRVCGEKVSGGSLCAASSGSPPRVRGKDTEPGFAESEFRITPACAGKSSTKRRHACSNRDHPRVCGEKSPRGHCLCYPIGSPPRVRGKA